MDKKKELFVCVSGPFSNMALQMPPIAFPKAAGERDEKTILYAGTLTGEVLEQKEKIIRIFHEEVTL